MLKQSAGILAYRNPKEIQFLLVHPGGPYFAKKDDGFWSIPKGEFTHDEEALTAAIREFREETGYLLNGNFLELKPITQKAGKVVYAWALEQDIDETNVSSNTFEMEWPPRSGKYKSFPEIDKAGWFTEEESRHKIIPAQAAFIDEVLKLLNP